jgi:ornithine cyclodeaminase/alanine dehydrogenase-like protein (mu-crystallin family)
MPLYLTEADVNSLLDMSAAIECLDTAFRAQANGEAVNSPRSRIPLQPGSYNLMSAAWHSKNLVGQKSYTASRGGVGFHVMLYDTTGKGLLAIIEANRMGQIRTGAASGVASRYMARPQSGRVAVIGSGYQARTQLHAVATALPIKSASVYSRTASNREGFAAAVTQDLEIDVTPAVSLEECVAGADVIVVITNATQPVLTGDLVEDGVHINAAGANSWQKRELDIRAVVRASVIAADDVNQAKIECADLMYPVDAGRLTWDQVRPLSHIVSGQTPARDVASDVTLFESQGVALEDIAVADYVYQRAMEQGVGTAIGG